MNKFKLGIIAAALPFILVATPPLYAQDQPPPPPAGAPPGAPAQAGYSQAELDQMLAPIALYPDQLLTQILMASTYPLQIVEAQRWLQNPNNAALQGDALVAALTPMPWDPSVKALVPFPQIVANLKESSRRSSTLPRSRSRSGRCTPRGRSTCSWRSSGSRRTGASSARSRPQSCDQWLSLSDAADRRCKRMTWSVPPADERGSAERAAAPERTRWTWDDSAPSAAPQRDRN